MAKKTDRHVSNDGKTRPLKNYLRILGLKEKLLSKLLWGCLTFLIGIGAICYGIYLRVNNLGGADDPMGMFCIGAVLIAIGIAFLINYHIGKNMLAKEMEAEENKLTTQE